MISGKELEALPDDPDELQSDLRSTGRTFRRPNGGQMYIDGFTAGQLPPKSSIREIRINQNPFSAEYDQLGYGRIEIFTKPGTDKLHGQLFADGNDSVFQLAQSVRRPRAAATTPLNSTETSAVRLTRARLSSSTSTAANINDLCGGQRHRSHDRVRASPRPSPTRASAPISARASTGR